MQAVNRETAERREEPPDREQHEHADNAFAQRETANHDQGDDHGERQGADMESQIPRSLRIKQQGGKGADTEGNDEENGNADRITGPDLVAGQAGQDVERAGENKEQGKDAGKPKAGMEQGARRFRRVRLGVRIVQVIGSWIRARRRSVPGREDALRHDALLEDEIGRHVGAGRGAAGVACLAINRKGRARAFIFGAAAFALPACSEARALARPDGRAPAQVWQGERGAAIAAILRAEEGEEGGILGNWQEAAIGLQRAAGAEIEARRDDLAKVFVHARMGRRRRSRHQRPGQGRRQCKFPNHSRVLPLWRG